MRTRSSESGDRTLIKIQPMWHPSTGKNMSIIEVERRGKARAWVTSSVGDLPILVLFRRQGYVCECRVRAHWEFAWQCCLFFG